tara:strand:+ start:968 stop:1171 length:204 start_codon:yes stop_codon:yes gene_type:complete
VGISRGALTDLSVITAARGALRLIRAINNPEMAVEGPLGLNGSSSDELMFSSLGEKDGSESMNREAV